MKRTFKKNRTRFFPGLLALALAGTTIARAQTKVFILSGQSNMTGVGKVSDLGSDLTPYTYPNISIYCAVDGQTTLTYDSVLKPGNTGTTLGPDGASFGPEIGIANVLSRQFPNEHLIFIKVAFGGTSLQDNWLNGVPTAGGVQVYPWFKNMVKAALASITEPKILSGMIWMQGETDASYSNMAPNYANNLKTFVGIIRSETDFGVPTPVYIPFAYGQIQNAPLNAGGTIWPYGSTVQSQQASAQYMMDNVCFTSKTSDANATVWPIETDNSALNKRHYDTGGQKYVGSALGSAMVDLLTGTAITAQYPNNWNFQQPSPFTTIAGDFNGDKKVDYARLSSTLYFGFMNNGSGTFAGQALGYPSGWDFGLPSNYTTITGDFNGDGKTDYARLGAASQFVFLSNGNGSFTPTQQNYPSGWNFGQPSDFTTITGDFNGDGKVDYARLSSTWYFVFLSNGNGTFAAQQQPYPSGWNFGQPSDFTTITGDFNGDGKMDYARLSSTCYFVFLSNGNGTFNPSMQNYPSGWNFEIPSPFTSVAGDFNMDGKTDYARLSSTCYFVFLSNGDGTFSTSQQAYPSDWNFGLPSKFTTETGDFDGKNGTDIARIDGTHVYYSISDGKGGFLPSVQYFPVGYNFGTLPLVYSVISGAATSAGRSSLIMLGGTYSHVMTKHQ